MYYTLVNVYLIPLVLQKLSICATKLLQVAKGVIIGGDLNAVLNPSMGRLGDARTHSTVLRDWVDSYDNWWWMHPDQKIYLCHSESPGNFSRLYMFFTTTASL